MTDVDLDIDLDIDTGGSSTSFDVEKLDGVEKAAILLLSLSEEDAAQILKHLEPRIFSPREVIYVELDEVNEILFIEQGEYDIGYEVNKTEKFKLRLGQNTVIGAFNICFNKR